MVELVKLMETVDPTIVLKGFVMVISQIKHFVKYMMIAKVRSAIKIYVELVFIVSPMYKLQL